MRKATPDQVEDLRKVERPQRRGKHWGHKSREVYHWGTIRLANGKPFRLVPTAPRFSKSAPRIRTDIAARSDPSGCSGSCP
jgi:hypothetical protein